MRNTAVPALSAVLFALFAAGCASGGGGPHKQAITAEGAPATGLFAPVVRTGNLLFLSGVIGRGGAGGIGAATRQALEGVRTRLATAGATMDDVVKCTVLLTDIAGYQAMNQVYQEFFPANPPARSAYAVRELPASADVEVECIAVVPG